MTFSIRIASVAIASTLSVAALAGNSPPALDAAPVVIDRNLAVDTKAFSEPAQAIAVDPETQGSEVTAPKPQTARSLAELVSMQTLPDQVDSELHCLATAIFYESRSEQLDGQLAVGRVIINRTQSGRFPTTICGVVTQHRQFSFVRGGRLPSVNTGSAQYRTAIAVAQIAREASWDSPVKGALFFHATHVSPGWKRERMDRIGNHVFYR